MTVTVLEGTSVVRPQRIICLSKIPKILKSFSLGFSHLSQFMSLHLLPESIPDRESTTSLPILLITVMIMIKVVRRRKIPRSNRVALRFLDLTTIV